MTLTLVTQWFNKLPIYERDLPLLIVDLTAYTPRVALDEVKRGTELGAKLQFLIEQKTFGTTTREEVELIKLRLKEILRVRPPDKPLFATLTLPSRTYTPQELAREVQNETSVGRQWINAEKKQMEYLMTLR